TTYALGEEGGRNDWNRRGRRGRNRWWQDNNRWGRGRNRYTTQALFEEGGWGNNQFDWDWWDRDRRRRRGNRNRNRNRYTTYALGEEG
ncbi:MAG: hypothetical protein KDA47_01120, partial [Planctomycetales bacterium]|nr:hypothetical protein [Planctomycetales bacterium]